MNKRKVISWAVFLTAVALIGVACTGIFNTLASILGARLTVFLFTVAIVLLVFLAASLQWPAVILRPFKSVYSGISSVTRFLRSLVDTRYLSVIHRDVQSIKKWVDTHHDNVLAIGNLLTVSEDMKSDIVLLSKAHDDHRNVMLKAFPWLALVDDLSHDDKQVRIGCLGRIRDKIRMIPSNGMTDDVLSHVIRILADLVHCYESDELKLVFAIRQESYGLMKESFPNSHLTLRNTARGMLGHERQAITDVVMLTYVETTGHADKWSCRELTSVAKRLRVIRESPEFNRMVDEGSLEVPPSFASTHDSKEGYARVWKRVWPSKTEDGHGPWGKIECHLVSGSECKSAFLEEVSLCGASCMDCDKRADEEIKKVELRLPCFSDPITIKKARFHRHKDGDYFLSQESQDKRISRGFALEFLDIEMENFEKLAAFVRRREELDRKNRPEDAPPKRRLNAS